MCPRDASPFKLRTCVRRAATPIAAVPLRARVCCSDTLTLVGREGVRMARVLVIDGKYIQVLTEFDGDPMAYTEFFRKQLGPVFQQIFSLVEGAPPWEEVNDPNNFYEYTRGLNLRSLGASTSGGEDRGYLFSSIGDTTVREIKAHLASQPSAPA